MRGRRDKRRHNLIAVCLQTESTGKVAAMVVARIERNPEQLCVEDESQVVSDVVQKGVRTLIHCKILRAKLEHLFVRVLEGPDQFYLQSIHEFLSDGDIYIIAMHDFAINAI